MDESTTPRGTGRLRRVGRRAATALAAVLMVVLVAPTAFAATGVTVKDTEGLAAVVPTSAANGFPTWYADKAGTRLEPCLDADNPLCGFLPGDIPDATEPIAFPANFPDEFLYFLAGAELALPGGRAVLTSGLEAAFLNAALGGDVGPFLKWTGTDAPAGYVGDLPRAAAFDIGLRTGAAPATNPGRIVIKSSGGGVAGPFTVANG
jgi:hypothetical protein